MKARQKLLRAIFLSIILIFVIIVSFFVQHKENENIKNIMSISRIIFNEENVLSVHEMISNGISYKNISNTTNYLRIKTKLIKLSELYKESNVLYTNIIIPLSNNVENVLVQDYIIDLDISDDWVGYTIISPVYDIDVLKNNIDKMYNTELNKQLKIILVDKKQFSISQVYFYKNYKSIRKSSYIPIYDLSDSNEIIAILEFNLNAKYILSQLAYIISLSIIYSCILLALITIKFPSIFKK